MLSRKRRSWGRSLSQLSSRSNRAIASRLGSPRSCARRSASRAQAPCGSVAAIDCSRVVASAGGCSLRGSSRLASSRFGSSLRGGGYRSAPGRRRRSDQRNRGRRQRRRNALEQALDLRLEPRAAELTLEADDLVGGGHRAHPCQPLLIAAASRYLILFLERRLQSRLHALARLAGRRGGRRLGGDGRRQDGRWRHAVA